MNFDTYRTRMAALNNKEPLTPETTKFMEFVREETQAYAERIAKARPETTDHGRFIAALDSLQATKNLFCDSAIQGELLGNIQSKRFKEAAARPETESIANYLVPHAARNLQPK
jgi:hypothetical protein